MLFNIYAIFDDAVQSYATPFVMQAGRRGSEHGSATRAFSRLCQEPNSLMYTNPGDFKLCYLGCFDSDTGKSVMQDLPVTLTKGDHFHGFSDPLQEPA